MREVSLPTMTPGTSVEVFSRFSATWVRGFEIASTSGSGYQLRRVSDRSVLPKTFSIDDLRARHPDGG
jgi:hypothetical protein